MKPNKDHRITFRMADDDYERLVKRCKDIEMSKSEYLRYLVSIPMVADAEDAEASDKFIVLDRWRCAGCPASSRNGDITTTKRCMR